jgi:hypothetical protein
MTSRAAFFIAYGLPYLIGANLLLVAMCMDSRWPIPHSELLPMVGLLSAVLFQAFLGVRLARRRPQLGDMASGVQKDELHWQDIIMIFRPSTIGGMFPTIGVFFTLLFGALLFGFGGIMILWAACAFGTMPVFPLWLRGCMIIDGLGMAAVPLLLTLLCTETGIVYLIRRLWWRGPRMNKDQFARWKAANPGAPMPWERGHHRGYSGPADRKGVEFHDKGSSDDRQMDG